MATTHNDTDLMTEEQLDTVTGGLIATVIVAANRPANALDGAPRAKPRFYIPTRRNLVSLWPGPALAPHRNQSKARREAHSNSHDKDAKPPFAGGSRDYPEVDRGDKAPSCPMTT